MNATAVEREGERERKETGRERERVAQGNRNILEGCVGEEGKEGEKSLTEHLSLSDS